ncbi:MAG: hypothetical protein IPO71_02350 [Nitrosomonas sp.]|nr:hypothetical protein [Nitrosomonas sp.]
MKPYVKSGKNDANDAEATWPAECVLSRQDGRAAGYSGGTPHPCPADQITHGVKQ